jgi:hypothetical protein
LAFWYNFHFPSIISTPVQSSRTTVPIICAALFKYKRAAAL